MEPQRITVLQAAVKATNGVLFKHTLSNTRNIQRTLQSEEMGIEGRRFISLPLLFPVRKSLLSEDYFVAEHNLRFLVDCGVETQIQVLSCSLHCTFSNV